MASSTKSSSCGVGAADSSSVAMLQIYRSLGLSVAVSAYIYGVERMDSNNAAFVFGVRLQPTTLLLCEHSIHLH